MTATVEAKYVVKMDRPTSDTSDSAFTRRYAGACPKCRFVLPPLDECAATYFEQGFVACSNCAERVDVWKAALETINAMPGLAWGLTAAGAAITNFTFDLEAGKFCSIDLTTHGIPAGATVLRLPMGHKEGVFSLLNGTVTHRSEGSLGLRWASSAIRWTAPVRRVGW